MQEPPVELLAPSGQSGRVIARLLVEAIERHVASPDNEDNFDSLSVRAGFKRNYINKLRAAVRANAEHTIDTSTLERLAAAIGYELTLAPKEPR